MKIRTLILALAVAATLGFNDCSDSDKDRRPAAKRDWTGGPAPAVPEPTAGLLFTMGLVTFAAHRRYRRKR